MNRREQTLKDARVVTFVWDRLVELDRVDPDGAAVGREALDACCDRIDCSPFGTPRGTTVVRGEVNNMAPLLKLARNWADHPDFLPEWETP